ncbi:MAG: asparaginase, partial [Alphaproteobacteria bacterium]|nr:asparaginase [Alphaproteobacteria bacterium]
MKALILNLGGTIGMVNSPEGLRPPASDSEFRKVVEGITAQYPDVEFDFETPFPPKDSTDVTPADWEKFSNRLMAAQRDYDFIICTHGTDTMAQTAMATTFGFLAKNGQDEVVNTQTTPVIFTGAQHPIFAEKSDAPDNLECAIETGIKAAQEGVADVLAVFHGRVMRGVNARKVSDVALDAYHSINGEYAGHFDSNGLHFTGEMRRIKPAEKAEITVQAEALTPLNRFQLPKKTYIEPCLSSRGHLRAACGILPATKPAWVPFLWFLGAGNVPDTLTKTVNEAAHNYHFPMFAVSPFPGGN